MRVINKGDKREYSLKISVQEKEFNFKTNRYKKSPAGNIKLNAIEQRAVDVIEQLEHVSYHAFEEKFFGKNVQDFTVAEYLNKIKEENYEKGKRGNGDVYKDTRASILKFNGSNLKFTDITPPFLENFEAHLKKTCGTTTVSMYMRTLRSAYNSAIDDKIVSVDLYPFNNKSGKGMEKKGIRSKIKKLKANLPCQNKI